ncbi:hypothetical protein GBA52_015397 [Prunus armeniaca]|nr:hypothetical protein GBA52_015397 [Prunus armeniaca]
MKWTESGPARRRTGVGYQEPKRVSTPSVMVEPPEVKTGQEQKASVSYGFGRRRKSSQVESGLFPCLSKR